VCEKRLSLGSRISLNSPIVEGNAIFDNQYCVKDFPKEELMPAGSDPEISERKMATVTEP
jgi:hypothetical protein